MRFVYVSAPVIAVAMITAAAIPAQETSRAVEGGGISVPG
jgi:hypothetical protein